MITKNRMFFLLKFLSIKYVGTLNIKKWRHLLHYPKNDNKLATNLAKSRSGIKGLKIYIYIYQYD